jgi:hypothetical protein
MSVYVWAVMSPMLLGDIDERLGGSECRSKARGGLPECLAIR